jgi:hypothetical protein
MMFYPEDAGKKLGEVWHGDKMMQDIPDHLLSPNIRHNGKIYYVNELVQCTDGKWFLPKRWVTRNNGKVMLASGYNMTESEASRNILLSLTSAEEHSQRGLVVKHEVFDIVEVSTFERNFDEILNATSGIYPLAGSYS